MHVFSEHADTKRLKIEAHAISDENVGEWFYCSFRQYRPKVDLNIRGSFLDGAPNNSGVDDNDNFQAFDWLFLGNFRCKDPLYYTGTEYVVRRRLRSDHQKYVTLNAWSWIAISG